MHGDDSAAPGVSLSLGLSIRHAGATRSAILKRAISTITNAWKMVSSTWVMPSKMTPMAVASATICDTDAQRSIATQWVPAGTMCLQSSSGLNRMHDGLQRQSI